MASDYVFLNVKNDFFDCFNTGHICPFISFCPIFQVFRDKGTYVSVVYTNGPW